MASCLICPFSLNIEWFPVESAHQYYPSLCFAKDIFYYCICWLFVFFSLTYIYSFFIKSLWIHFVCLVTCALCLMFYFVLYIWLRFGLLVAIIFVVRCSDKIKFNTENREHVYKTLAYNVEQYAIWFWCHYWLSMMMLTTTTTIKRSDPHDIWRFIGWRGRERELICSEVLNVFQKLNRERANVASVTWQRKVIPLKIIPKILCSRLLINCFSLFSYFLKCRIGIEMIIFFDINGNTWAHLLFSHYVPWRLTVNRKKKKNNNQKREKKNS